MLVREAVAGSSNTRTPASKPLREAQEPSLGGRGLEPKSWAPSLQRPLLLAPCSPLPLGEQAALRRESPGLTLPITLRPVIPPFFNEKAELRRERLLLSPRALELNSRGPRHQPQHV